MPRIDHDAARDPRYEFTVEQRVARLEAAVGQISRQLYNYSRGDSQPGAPIGRRACQELIEELALIEESL